MSPLGRTPPPGQGRAGPHFAGADMRTLERPATGRGALIAIEGIDGAGKSTQAARLAVTLRQEGYEVVASREPTDGPYGQRIREIARTGRRGITPEEEVRLFLDDRREHVKAVIVPALVAGKVVVLDRYYLSTMAYQGALGVDPTSIQRANETFAPAPDLAFVLTLPVRLALARIRTARAGGLDLAFEREAYLKRVAGIFAGMAARLNPARTAVKMIDAAADPDAVAAELAAESVTHLVALDVPRPGR